MARNGVRGNAPTGNPEPQFLSDIVKGEAVQVTPNGSSFGSDNPTVSNLLNDDVLYGFRGGGWQQGAMHRSDNTEVEKVRKIYGGNRSGE